MKTLVFVSLFMPGLMLGASKMNPCVLNLTGATFFLQRVPEADLGTQKMISGMQAYEDTVFKLRAGSVVNIDNEGYFKLGKKLGKGQTVFAYQHREAYDKDGLQVKLDPKKRWIIRIPQDAVGGQETLLKQVYPIFEKHGVPTFKMLKGFDSDKFTIVEEYKENINLLQLIQGLRIAGRRRQILLNQFRVDIVEKVWNLVLPYNNDDFIPQALVHVTDPHHPSGRGEGWILSDLFAPPKIWDGKTIKAPTLFESENDAWESRAISKARSSFVREVRELREARRKRF